MSNLDIKTKVKKLINKYKTNNPYELAKSLDVILLIVPLNGVNGFYNYYKRNHIIYIDESLNEYQRRIVLAHELGHLVLHKKTNAIYLNNGTSFVTQKYETEADIFASELLISDELILENADYTLEAIASLNNVDVKHIKHKLDGLK